MGGDGMGKRSMRQWHGEEVLSGVGKRKATGMGSIKARIGREGERAYKIQSQYS